MASNSQQSHSLLNTAKTLYYYQMIDGYEQSTAAYWDERYAVDFPAHSIWSLNRQQFVHRDIARNPKIKYDALLQAWAGEPNCFVKVALREDKKDKQSARDLENQALNYAKILVEEGQLEKIYVHTTMGKLFRTWEFDGENEVLTPLFGGKGHNPNEYVEISTPKASVEWTNYVDKVKGASLLLKAPTLGSQVLDTGSSSWETHAAAGYPELTTAGASDAPSTYSVPLSSIKFTQLDLAMNEPEEHEQQSYHDFEHDSGSYGSVAGPSAAQAQYLPTAHSSAMEIDADEHTDSVNEDEYTRVSVTAGNRERVTCKISRGKDKGKVVEVRREKWQKVTIKRNDGTIESGYVAETSKHKYLTFDDLKGKSKHRH